MTISELNDKIAIMQVFGCLMNDTSILSQKDKFKLIPQDFELSLSKIIFAAIVNMYDGGMLKINEIDIVNYLKDFKDLQKIFESKESNGLQYLQDCLDIADREKFEYYYKRVKKFSVLRALKKDGYNIDKIYCTNPIDTNYKNIQANFDAMTIQDIFNFYKKPLAELENQYTSTSIGGSDYAAEGLKDLKDNFKKIPEIGLPLQGQIYNTVCRGARKGKYYLRSLPSGAGKTRLAVGDACNLSIPEFFDVNTRQWIKKSVCEKSLFITTELDKEEVQTLILAWVSGVNEDVILNNTYSFEEEARVDRAIQIVEENKDNFIIDHIPNPSVELVRACVRKNVLVYGINNVFFDYIFSNPSLLAEFASLNIREDVALGMLSTALKDLAVELGVFMASSSQLSGDVEGKKGIRDQRFLRGAKALADKIDFGCIGMWIVGEELQIITNVVNKENLEMPNMVFDVYKARRSKYKNVKIWSKVDLGTCQIKDLFITDGYYNQISDFTFLDLDKYFEIIKSKDEEEKILISPLPEKKKPEKETTVIVERGKVSDKSVADF